MDTGGWWPTYVRWARSFGLGLLLAPAVWAVVLRPPKALWDVAGAFIATLLLGWPWILVCLLVGPAVSRRFGDRARDLIAVLAAIAVAAGTAQLRLIAS